MTRRLKTSKTSESRGTTDIGITGSSDATANAPVNNVTQSVSLYTDCKHTHIHTHTITLYDSSTNELSTKCDSSCASFRPRNSHKIQQFRTMDLRSVVGRA